jgi:hypothetical protein
MGIPVRVGVVMLFGGEYMAKRVFKGFTTARGFRSRQSVFSGGGCEFSMIRPKGMVLSQIRPYTNIRVFSLRCWLQKSGSKRPPNGSQTQPATEPKKKKKTKTYLGTNAWQ